MSLIDLDKGLDFLKVSTCIDYLEFIMVGDHWTVDNPVFVLLCSVLRINPCQFVDDGRSNKHFKRVLIFDANIYLHTDPVSDREDDQAYYKIQMAGQACREFENRGGDWIELGDFLLSHSAKIMHIDLAADDFAYIPLEQLKEFIREHWYTSNFRKTCREKYRPCTPQINVDAVISGLDIDSEVPVLDKRDQRERESYSATWGTRQSVQFQIYDKFAERLHAGYDVIGNQWIRFEMRFYDSRADLVFAYAIKALKSSTFSQLVARLLYGLIDFKNLAWGSSSESRNYNKLSTWKPYLDFLGDLSVEDKLKVKPAPQQVDIEKAMTKKRNWIKDSVSKTELMLFCEDPEGYFEFIQDHMAEKVKAGKFTYRDAAIVNYGRVRAGKEKMTYEQFLDFFRCNLGVEPEEETEKRNQYAMFDDDLPF